MNTRRANTHRWSGYVFAAPYLLLFTLFLVLPLLYGLGLSFFRWDMLSTRPAQFVGGENFNEAFADAYFWKALVATLRFVALSVPPIVAVALLIAVAIHSVPHKRQAFYRASYFLPTILTISVVGILWRWFFNSEFGLFNALLAPLSIKVPWITDADWAMPSLAFMTLWWTAGGPMIILLAGLQGIPVAYHEAAALDGATAGQRFWRITLPLLRPVLLFVVVLNIIGAFQVFGQVYMITRGGPELSTRTLVQYIYETAFQNYRMGYAATLSWLLFLIIAVFSVIQFRMMKER
ncbi:MAG: sugar ABC transporter permease [Armatimonadaceae bacterium]